MISAQTTAIQDIKDKKISINRVAKESGFAKKTFYNNPIITSYIEQYLLAYSVDNPYETIEALRDESRSKDEQDATVSKYEAQKHELTDEIVSLQATIKSQEELIRQLQASVKTGKLYNKKILTDITNHTIIKEKRGRL